MDSTDDLNSQALADEVIEQSARRVLAEFGPRLTEVQFNSVMLSLLTLPPIGIRRHRMEKSLQTMWIVYHDLAGSWRWGE